MKKHFPRLSRIALKDWLEYHPYNREVSSDHFYIDLCNDLQHEILHTDVEDHLVGADYKWLSCVLGCYFEDIISQTGIWTSFIDEHSNLYGKYLPFYDMAGYERGDINLADIQFLIWHFSSHLTIRSHFTDPYSLINAEIAHVVYNLLSETSGIAPRNDDLKEALTLKPDADIDTVNEHLDFCFFGCYLHHYYMTTLLEEGTLDVKNRKGSQHDIDYKRLQVLFNRVTPLLAQHSGEILACWAGETHPLYKNLKSYSKCKEGIFLYEGCTVTHFQMKHIASGKLIDVKNPNWDFSLEAGKTIVRIGIVQWGDDWYAIGPAFPMKNTKISKIIDKEKSLFAPVSSQLGIVKRQDDCFLEVNQNKRILFMGSKHETFLFIDRVWEAYHLKYGMDTIDRKMFDVLEVTFNVDDELENLVIFFNPSAGMEFYPNIAQYISINNNPYFDKNAETNIENLILDERISTDFIRFLIENKMIETEQLTGEEGYHYVLTDCDFLLRYWKKERYLSEPNLFVE